MACLRPLFSAAQALRRTFISSIESQTAAQVSRQRHALPTRQLRYYRATPISQFSQRPHYPPPPATSAASAASRSSLPKDEEIRSAIVRVVQENGQLGEPMSLKSALASFDRSRNFLVQVRAGSEDQAPVCKIVDKSDYSASLKAKARGKESKPKSTAVQIKQIELNWAIDPHDLQHRLDQLETFLSKGKRVSLILTKKKRKRRATPDEAQRVLAAIENKLFEIGVTEVKPRRGKIMEHMEYVLDKKKAAA
ncbi:translation initiation factor IF-3 [Trichophyton rubrum D6]|uniref:Translation initiation factor IF-3 n=4 Tax=Trichophyton TaxID=5550 RepID=A0A178EXM9_TRIRU|nr:translation initiation factor IF-3 [Trichophyton rubrum CBS 118892]EZF23413.1 translation initiation factor IF-3 [Trichophyton rubrum MR850]EZF42570.1 translation initiation factor IF-3 [Trichophyton rubrum CBS 100081]EZF53187.1 translation initiation factor IF-3 [Trichophyton rubrum CBS 288.86]EZF63855.1 translation initiation factor IF-3 [Trichophyton rubrum CBS 289.86]EZF74175.1 translation initiation factor IF-3 [Trichophyton soudanense CBS 452.61]EZF85134.1 translation initiation fact